MKIDSKLIKDIKLFRKALNKFSDDHSEKYQEYILCQISLLLNPLFRTAIDDLRIKYKIPYEFYSIENYDDGGKKFNTWYYGQKLTPPYSGRDKEIYDLCKKCKVNPKIYGEFITDYLYFGGLNPLPPSFEYYFTSKEEFRYKCRIELNYGGETMASEFGVPTTTPQEAYIRFFNDTSKKGLINFIETNWDEIKQVKKKLKSYPYARTKRYKNFKRDIQIYLLFLQGMKPSEIPNNIDYEIDNSRIYEVIKEIGQRLKTSLE